MPQKRTIPRTCLHCNSPFLACANQVKIGRAKYCCRECADLGKRVALTDAFWTSVDRSGDCWEWTGRTGHGGYGALSGSHLPVRGAHRAAWLLTYGAIPDGLWVLHKCDNPKCCRPDHLFLGTIADNVQDMVQKGRHTHGNDHPRARLTEDQVRDIRRRHENGEPVRALARELGLGRNTVRQIVFRLTWKHVP